MKTSDLIVDGSVDSRTANFGTNSNKVNINVDGDVRLTGSSTVWDDLLGPATSTKQGSTFKPDFDYTDIIIKFLPNSPSEKLYYSLQLTHDWKQGSTIYPHVHYIQESNNYPIFKMDYRWLELGSQIPNWQTYIMDTPVFTYTSGAIHQLATNTTGISGVGYTLSSILQLTLYRDDNIYPGICKMLSFDIHIEKDTLGSFTDFQK